LTFALIIAADFHLLATVIIKSLIPASQTI
jgi:hypothetical protein